MNPFEGQPPEVWPLILILMGGTGGIAGLLLWGLYSITLKPLYRAVHRGAYRLVRDGAGGWWVQEYAKEDPDSYYDHLKWLDRHGPFLMETAMDKLQELHRAKMDRKALAQRKPVKVLR